MGCPSVGEVREEVRGSMCVCRGVGLPWGFCSLFPLEIRLISWLCVGGAPSVQVRRS